MASMFTKMSKFFSENSRAKNKYSLHIKREHADANVRLFTKFQFLPDNNDDNNNADDFKAIAIPRVFSDNSRAKNNISLHLMCAQSNKSNTSTACRCKRSAVYKISKLLHNKHNNDDDNADEAKATAIPWVFSENSRANTNRECSNVLYQERHRCCN